MSWDDCIGELRNRLPKFNDYLLIGYKEEQFHQIIPYIEYVFRQACALLSHKTPDDNFVEYIDHQVLTPEQALSFISTDKHLTGNVDIQNSDLQLVRFNFRYEYTDKVGQRQYGDIHTCLFIPYLVNGAVTKDGTKYFPQLVIREKMIHHVENGILIKVLRSPITFWRKERNTSTTVTGEKYSDMKIQVKAHQKKSSNKNDKVPLLLYLLARYGLTTLLTNTWFGLSLDDVSFETSCPIQETTVASNVVTPIDDIEDIDIDIATSTMEDVKEDDDTTSSDTDEDEDTTSMSDEDDDEDNIFLSNPDELEHINDTKIPLILSAERYSHDPNEYIYFKCRDDVYLKVKREVMDSVVTKRFVLDLLDIIKMKTNGYMFEQLYSAEFYKTILGKQLYPNTLNDDLAHNHACDHLDSLEDYLDEHTRDNLDNYLNEYFGSKIKRTDRNHRYHCNNIYELFLLVLTNIDDWISSYIPNNLLTKCLENIESLIMVDEGVGTGIFTKVYNAQKSKKFYKTEIENTFKLTATVVIKRIQNVAMLQSLNGLYNDNVLVSVLAKKSRPNSSKKNRKKNKENLLKSKEYQFHSSVMAVEDILNIPSSSPGITGDINPYLQIDDHGNFLEEKMPWYATVKSLDKHLIKV